MSQTRPTSVMPVTRRRRRPALSCRECRRRKIRCDHNSPCAHCVRNQSECVYRPFADDGPVVGPAADDSGPRLGAFSRPRPGVAAAQAGNGNGNGNGIGGGRTASTIPPRNAALSVPLFRTPGVLLEGAQTGVGDAAVSAYCPVAPRPGLDLALSTPGAAPTPASAPSGPTSGPAAQFSPDICAVLLRVQKLEESLAARNALGATTTTTDASPTLLARSEASVAPNRDRDLHRDPDPRLGDDEDSHDNRFCNRVRGRDDGVPVSNQSPGKQPELKVREWNRTRWVGDAPDFAIIISCYRGIMGKTMGNAAFRLPETAAVIAEASASLQRCKAIAKGMKVVRPTTRGQQSMAGQGVVNLGLPGREVAGEMARVYFSSFESAYRILHTPTFWADFYRYWADPTSVSDQVRHTISLVVAIGSSIHHSPHATGAAGAAGATQHDTDAVHHWIYAAETWLSGPLEKDRLDVAGLQVHCLAILARQIFPVGGGDTVWVSMGSLLHSAMRICMHRDPRHLPPMSVLQAELRRRLWVTILDLIVQSSLDAWMPPRIALDEYDVEAPANVDDDEMDETTTTAAAAEAAALRPHSHPREVLTDTSVQLALLDSLPTRLRIVQFLNSFRKDRSYSRALALTAELTDSLHANTVFLSQGMPDNTRNNAFRRDMLDYLTRRFLLPLHFPFSHQARTNPLFCYSRKVSLDAAFALVSKVATDPDLHPELTRTNPNPALTPNPPNPTHTTTHTTTTTTTTATNIISSPSNPPPTTFTRLLTTAGGGMFRDGMRSATAALALELLAHADTQRRRDGSWHRTRALRDTLAGEIRGLLAMAARRMETGAEKNAKAHMLLEMVLAQVGVDEEGYKDGGVERAVAMAARGSLVFAEGVLRARAEEVERGRRWRDGGNNNNNNNNNNIGGANGNLAVGGGIGGSGDTNMVGAAAAAAAGGHGLGLVHLGESPGDSEYGFAADGLFQGFDFDGFGEEFAWESLFPDARFC